MTWTCPLCGKVLGSESEYRMHVCQGRTMNVCPACGGTGYKTQSLGPSIVCPTCGGKGKV